MSDIIIEHLTQKYGRRHILNDISLTASRGDCVGIVGINGGGKSTLLSTLAGIRRPTSGRYDCFGHNMLREKKQYARLIGYLPQENPLVEDLTAWDNLKLWYGRRLNRHPGILSELELEELRKIKVKAMSGGMKRRLAIACSAAENPPILILDEPTAALDLYHKRLIKNYISRFTEDGGIVLLSTHDPREIKRCSKLYFIDENGISVPLSANEAMKRLSTGREESV